MAMWMLLRMSLPRLSARPKGLIMLGIGEGELLSARLRPREVERVAIMSGLPLILLSLSPSRLSARLKPNKILFNEKESPRFVEVQFLTIEDMSEKGRKQCERKSTTCGEVEIQLSLDKRHSLSLQLYVSLPVDILLIQNLRSGVCELPNQKETVYGALDKWTAWEIEFPLIAVAKALKSLRKRGLWLRVIKLRALRLAFFALKKRVALLKIKKDLKDPPANCLSSSVGEDCCYWQGIECDNQTGHILKLHIRLETFESHLDLSSNDFEGIPIPKFIGSRTILCYLDLSYAHFAGMIPTHLAHPMSCFELSMMPSLVEFLFRAEYDAISGGVIFIFLQAFYSASISFSPLPVLGRGNLCKLQNLHLYSNDLTGDMTQSVGVLIIL
ncbi:hypothetical protein Fmac_009006 [Flemingia macrophylla]|uniref:Leucine-rich repeat-containing N-terminal plant-type domain-containing protein n=1 Tax=Flemingia macrophylla TaxID=520843 RepID=A0ABD1MZ03_9FABA